MPTPIDRAMQSRNLFLGFAGLVVLASVSGIFGGDMFPAQKDPTGDPETWTDDELRRWLQAASYLFAVCLCFAYVLRSAITWHRAQNLPVQNLLTGSSRR